MILNIHIYPSTYYAQTRIMKEAKSLLKLGLVDRIILIGIHEKGFAEKEEIYPGIEIHRIKLLLKNSILKPIRYLSFLEFLFKAYFYTRKIPCTIVNVHSIHVLLVGVLMKHRSKCKLVYDTHELETEVTGSIGFLRFLSKFLERYCIQFIDEVIVVSESIRKWYKDTYKISNITTIYNVPIRPEPNTFNRIESSLRSTIGVNKDKLLFIYQGLLTRARGVDELLDAFCGVGEELHIVFMGNGPLKSLIQNAANEYPNIHYHKPVSSDQVIKYTGEADIGIHIIQNTCLNHYYCLPNKIFEYLMAGIPFIVSNFPEMSKIVADTGGGWTCNPNKKDLMEKISRINREEIDSKKVNIQKNLEKYGWQKEELKYIAIYERLTKKV